MEVLRIERDHCKGCGLCIEFCPQHCLTLTDDLNSLGYHPAELHDVVKCTSCALCAQVCPETGIEVNRRRKPPAPGPAATEASPPVAVE